MSTRANRRAGIAGALVLRALALGALVAGASAGFNIGAEPDVFATAATDGGFVELSAPALVLLRSTRPFFVPVDPVTRERVGPAIRARVGRGPTGHEVIRVGRAAPGVYAVVLRRADGSECVLRGDVVIRGPSVGHVPAGAYAVGDRVLVPGVFPSRRGLRVDVGGVRARSVRAKESRISFRVPRGLPPGEHDVVVRSRSGASEAASLLAIEGQPGRPTDSFGIDGDFAGTWIPDGVSRSSVDVRELPDGLVRIYSGGLVQGSLDGVGVALPEIEMRLPAAAIQGDPAASSVAVTLFVVRQRRRIAGQTSVPIEFWKGEGTVTARLVASEEVEGRTRFSLAFSGVLDAVDSEGAPRAAAPIVIRDGIVTASHSDLPRPTASAKLRLTFGENQPEVDAALTNGAVGTVIPGAATPPSPPLRESAVYTRFLGLGVRDPRAFVSAVHANDISASAGDACVVEAQFTREVEPEDLLRGPRPDLTALGLDLETTNPAVTSPWYLLAARDDSGLPGGAFPELGAYDPAIDGEIVDVPLPSSEIEAAGYTFVRFRVRFRLDAAHQAGDEVPSVAEVGFDFQFDGESN